MSPFFGYDFIVGKPKNNVCKGRKKQKEKKGKRMAEDGEDWNGLEMTILKVLQLYLESVAAS